MSLSCTISEILSVTKKPSLLKFTYLLQSWTEFIFLLLKGIILTNYFEITRKLK